MEDNLSLPIAVYERGEIMVTNFEKLRMILDKNKFNDEYITSLLSEAYSECLAYTGRESLPNEKYNNEIFNMAVALHKKQSLQPIYASLSKYVIQGYYGGETDIIFVNELPTHQEKGQIYVIKGKTTSKFYQDGKLIKTITNQDDDSPYTDEDGKLFDNHRISASATYGDYENQEFPNGGD